MPREADADDDDERAFGGGYGNADVAAMTHLKHACALVHKPSKRSAVIRPGLSRVDYFMP